MQRICHTLCTLGLSLLVGAIHEFACAEDARSADAPVPIASIRYFPEDPAALREAPERHTPVVIVGTVTWISADPDRQAFLVIQDESAGIWATVRLARDRGVWRGDDAKLRRIRAGMQVEMEGLQELDAFAPMIIPRSIRIISEDIRLPDAEPATMDRLFSGCDACRRIEVEGLLRGFRQGFVHGTPHWILVMATSGHRFLVTIPHDELTPDPAHLVDGILRVRGVAASRFTTRGEFIAPTIQLLSADDIITVAAPRLAPFESPKLPLARISRFQKNPPSANRIRTEGIVSHAVPGELFYLQDGATGLRVESQTEEILHPGDRVEVAGFVDRGRVMAGISEAAGITEAVIRRLGNGPPPRPIVIQPDDIVAINTTARANGLIASPGDYDGCLVTFRARLLEIRRTLAGGVFLLSAGKSAVVAAIPTMAFTSLKNLSLGSELQVTGIVQADIRPETHNSPIWLLPSVDRVDLLLRTADDVRVIGSPSWWTPRRLVVALAATGGILSLALGWVWLLRQQVAATAARLLAEMRTRREAAVEFSATLRERNRIAANLHDTLLQTMSAIGMQLQSCELSRVEDGLPPAPHLGLARRMVEHAIGELRQSVWALRSFPLKGQRFTEAVSSMVALLGTGQRATINVNVIGDQPDVPDFVAGNLLLVVQEAIRNALHHANAKTIDVGIAFDAQHDTIDVTVADDGAGFVPGTQPGALQGHFGLQGMRERTERLGGSIDINSAPGQGTSIRARVRNCDYDREIAGD
jgi:signal transduction histidine kinase